VFSNKPIPPSSGHRILDLGKILPQRVHRLEQSDQPASAHRLDYQTVAGTVNDRFVARQCELDGNTDRLVAALRNNLTCRRLGMGYLQADARNICCNSPDDETLLSIADARPAKISSMAPTGAPGLAMPSGAQVTLVQSPAKYAIP
jgi:hypothetical protein